MRLITQSTKFKRDIKRGLDMDKLSEVVQLLAKGKDLPARHHPHKLSGNYKHFGNVILCQTGY